MPKPPHPHKPPPTLSKALSEQMHIKDILQRAELGEDERVRLADQDLMVTLR